MTRAGRKFCALLDTTRAFFAADSGLLAGRDHRGCQFNIQIRALSAVAKMIQAM